MAVGLLVFTTVVTDLLSDLLFPWLLPAVSTAWHRTLGYLAFAAISLPVVALIGWHHGRTIATFRRQERMERTLSNAGDDLVLHIDSAGSVTWACDALTRITGWTLEELQTVPWRERVHPDDIALCNAVRSACLAELRAGSAVYRIMRRDGSFMWVETVMLPLRDEQGRPDGFVSRSRDVSKFVELREELRQQADRMSLAQRAGNVGVWEALMGERRLVLSDMIAELLGLRPGETLSFDEGKAFIYPDDLQSCSASFKRAMTEGGDFAVTLRIVTRHRGLRWMTFTAKVFRDERAIGTCIDVTDQTRQREQLARSEATLLAFVDHAPAAIVMVDRNLRCVLASRRWQQQFPTRGEAILGRSLAEVVPEGWPYWRAAFERVLAGELVVRSDSKLRRASGEELWLRWEIRPWLGSDGENAGAILLIEDLSAQKSAEQELLHARTMVEEAERIARVGSWSFRTDTGEVKWSRETYRLFDRDESLGPPDYAWVLSSYEPESSQRLDAAVRRAVAEGTSYEIQLRPRWAPPGVRVMCARASPVFGPDQRTVVALVGTIADVTAEVEREDELRRAREAADRGNRAKSEFLASMSHEIRTPMTAILGYAELLVADRELQSDPDRVRAAAETVRSNGKHLLAIINDILDLSKIEAGKLEVEHLPTSVYGVLHEIVHLLEPGAKAKGLGIELRCDVPKGQILILDPIRVRQIVVNLVANAIKFTSAGSVRIEADVVGDGVRSLVVRVIDTGIGMSDDQMSRLFHAFEQGDASTARRFGGTGLGLRISLRLAELMGGDLVARSVPGKGSTFTLTLPAIAPAERVVPGRPRSENSITMPSVLPGG